MLSQVSKFPRNPRFSVLCRLASALCLAMCVLPAVTHAATRQVSLAWDPSTDPSVTGYKVQYGTEPGEYTQSVDVGNTTSAVISNLTPGTDFYIVVMAYRPGPLHSGPSNEVIFTSPEIVPPSVEITSPGNGTQANGPFTVNVAAQVADPDAMLARVELYQGGQKIGESSGAPFGGQAQNLLPGSYTFTAVAVDTLGGRWTSSPVTFQVVELRTGGAHRRADGTFEMTVAGAVGSTNRVWYSSDLVEWHLLQTVQNTNGAVVIEDPSASSVTKRFYKVTSP